MPIEIKELHIKAVVAPQETGKKDTMDKAALEKMKREILKECLQEVRNMINEHKNR